MRKKTVLLSALIACVSVLHPSFALPETLYLQNGQTIEGTILSDDERGIVLDLGYGTMTIRRTEIDHIEQSTKDAQLRFQAHLMKNYFTHDNVMPPRFKSLAESYEQLISLRQQALRDLEEKERLQKRLSGLTQDTQQQQNMLSDLRKRMSRNKNTHDIETYNALIKEYNASVAQQETAERQQEDITKQIQTLDQAISTYMNALRRLTKDLEGASETPDISENESAFLDTIRQEISTLGKDYREHTVSSFAEGSHLIVEAVLNQSVTARLLVDTGASVVVLSPRIADQLGISFDQDQAYMTTVADGRKVQAYPCILSSISVGDVTLNNISAAVITESTAQEDGLLGMSFLSHFVLRMDPQNNQLILEEFNP